jgi:hypothetical protein
MITPLPPSYVPRFRRVAQSHGFDCWAACVAMLANKTLAQVCEVAGLINAIPANGPYWISDVAIAMLLGRYGWVSTLYKPTTGYTDELGDLSIVLLDYDETTELGRHALMYRERELPGSPNRCVLIDPANWISEHAQVRILEDGEVSFFIAVHEMNYDY